MNVKEFKQLLLKLEVFPSGAEVVYGDNIHEVIGLAHYSSLDDAIFEYPVSPMSLGWGNHKVDIDEYIEYMYDLEGSSVEEIKNNFFYQWDDKWYYDFAPQVAPFLHGDIKVLNLYYSDRELLKRYFELHGDINAI